MKKTTKIMSLLLFLLICCCGVMASCKDNKVEVELLDWEPDETIVAKLGTTFNVPADNVVGTDGKTYSVIASAVTKDLTPVVIAGKKILLVNSQGYIVTLTVKITTEDIKTRTITINIIDDTAPLIVIEDSKVGTNGVLFDLPLVTATDISGEEIIPKLSVYKTNTQTGYRESFDIIDNKFMPTDVGSYEFVVTAKDSCENKSSKLVYLNVSNQRENPYKGEVESFNSAHSIDSVKDIGWGSRTSKSWVESYKGKTGGILVAKVLNHTSSSYPSFSIKPRQDKNAYKDYEFVRFSVFIKSSNPEIKSMHVCVFENMSYDGKPASENFFPEPNTWLDIVVPIKKYLAIYDDLAAGRSWLMVNNDSITAVDEIGISAVMATREPKITTDFDENKSYKKGDTVVINFQYDIADVVMNCIVKRNSTDIITFERVGNKISFVANEAGEYQLQIKTETLPVVAKNINIVVEAINKITFSGEIKNAKAGSLTKLKDCSIAGVSVGIAWKHYINDNLVTLTANNEYTFPYTGTYTVRVDATVNAVDYAGLYKVFVSERKDAIAGEVESFNDPMSIEGVSIFGGDANPEYQKSWVDTYEGKDGGSIVLSNLSTAGDSYPRFSILPRFEKDSYADFKNIKITLFIKDGRAYSNGVLNEASPKTYTSVQFFFQYKNGDVSLQENFASVPVNSWVNLYVSADYFRQCFDKIGNEMVNGFFYITNTDWTPTNAGKIFNEVAISSITAINEDEIELTYLNSDVKVDGVINVAPKIGNRLDNTFTYIITQIALNDWGNRADTSVDYISGVSASGKSFAFNKGVGTYILNVFTYYNGEYYETQIRFKIT